ncbi:MAG: hypothetical protein ACM4D3_09055 [Candidatus Sericytochromatia bacterium]
MGKHSSQVARQSVTKAALVGGAAATAAAMTVGMAAPSANAAALPFDPVDIVPTQVAQAADTIGGFFEVPVRLGEGFATSGLRIVEGALLQPAGIAQLATAIAKGDRAEVARLIGEVIDSPMWVARPSFEALEKVLPEPLSKLVHDVYVRALDIRDAVRDAVQSFILGEAANTNLVKTAAATSSDPIGDAIDAFVAVTKGFAQTGINAVEGTLLAPVSVVLLGAAVIQGKDDQAKYLAQQIIDAPLWIATPALHALTDNLDPPIGGANGLADKIWNQGYEIRQAIRTAVLGSPDTLPKPAGLPGIFGSPDTTATSNTAKAGLVDVKTPVTALSVNSNAADGGTKQDLAQVYSAPLSVATEQTTPKFAKGSDDPFSLSEGQSSSSTASRGSTPPGTARTNVQNQLQSAAQNAQSQLQNAAQNAQNQISNTVTSVLGKRPQANTTGSSATSSGTESNTN